MDLASLQAFKQEVYANKSAILREIQANSSAMTTLNQDIDTLDEAADDASWTFQQEVHSDNSVILHVLKINSSAITTLNQEVHTLSEAIDAAITTFKQEVHANNSTILRELQVNSSAIRALSKAMNTAIKTLNQKVLEFRETQHKTRQKFSETTIAAITTLEWWVNNFCHSIPARTRLNLSDDINGIAIKTLKQKAHEFRETQHKTRQEFSETTIAAITTLEWWVNNYFHSIPARTRLNLSDDINGIQNKVPFALSEIENSDEYSDVGDKEELNENSDELNAIEDGVTSINLHH